MLLFRLFPLFMPVLIPVIIICQSSEQIEMQTLRLKEKLSLSAEQTAQVREILKSHHEQMKRDDAGTTTSRRERFKASLAMMERSDAEIEKLLTKEQKRKFEAFKEERRTEMRERMKERQL